MRLINTGLGRTGTSSLQAALAALEYGPSFHMMELRQNVELLQRWERAICEGESPDWPSLMEGFDCAVNGPTAIYYREAAAAFPDAKLVLTIRDAEEWYESTHATLFQFAKVGMAAPPPRNSQPGRMLRLADAMVWSGLFDGCFADKAYAIDVYHRHNEDVVQACKGRDLLVYNVKQGWDPLCEFLGVPIPRTPYPRANERSAMHASASQFHTE